ncbi:hypothetical protein [Pseudoalteromonas phenolica]|uniref:hypothetical protein n=1 Tax=Pseudoalteromonas phenolica TaxID=161398 RepID=UPI00110B614A|nr:hypothetical protein [Pseudoalteromonas phenolica]TMO54083.1 hypothetical protein CWC21_16485 [Pseudoalteromonas phenolica]
MSNSLNRFSAVLSKQQRSIVEVVSVNPNGTTLVRHSDSSLSTVLGDSVESGNAYIENGRILAAAPQLPYSEIQV